MKSIKRRHVAILILALFLLTAAALLGSCRTADGECLHSSVESTAFEPTCSLQGYILHRCRDCGYLYKSDFREPVGHVISSVLPPPTCTEQGNTVYACSVCDYTYTADYVAPLGHDLQTTITDPTCEDSGFTTYTCTRACGFTYQSDLVAPLGHNLAEAHFSATCTTGSYTLYMCGNCDLEYRSATSKPLGHTFTERIVYPSISRTGYTEHTCACGYSYEDNYVWYSNIFTGAAGDGSKIIAKGLDLSYYQKNIDWEALAATGIDYIILRAAYYPKGSPIAVIDPKFEEYYAAARQHGFDIGCYLYSMATTVEESIEEAEILLDIIRGKKFEYPVYFDFEDPSMKWIDTDLLMDMCLTFCHTLSDNGYFPAVYTNHDWLIKRWDQEQLTTLYDIWYARYPLDNDETRFTFEKWKTVPSYAGDYGMWQFTEYGRIDGISGDVDLNMCYKDYPTLIKTYGYNGFTAKQ